MPAPHGHALVPRPAAPHGCDHAVSPPRHGALGPVGGAPGSVRTCASERPYGAYGVLGFRAGRVVEQRRRARPASRSAWTRSRPPSTSLGRRSTSSASGQPALWHHAPAALDGVGLGSVEAPQGELIYLVEVTAGRLTRVKQRSASFHNLALFPQAFGGDILTDFTFIEASFGLSIAGVAG